MTINDAKANCQLSITDERTSTLAFRAELRSASSAREQSEAEAGNMKIMNKDVMQTRCNALRKP